MQICFADNDGTGRFNGALPLRLRPEYDRRRPRWRRLYGCPRVDVVLQRNGNAVQGTTKFAGSLFSFQFTRLRQSLVAQNVMNAFSFGL